VLGVILVVGVVAIFLTRGFYTSADSAAAGSGQAAPLPAEASTDRDPVTVTVAPVSLRPIQRTVHVVGTFVGYDEVTVTAEVSGRVVELRHDVGDIVQPGEVLLKIDPTDYRLSLEEAWRALELDAARIGLPVPVIEDLTPEKVDALVGEVRRMQGRFDINSLPPVRRAREQEDNARKRYERAKLLREQKVMNQEVFEEQQTLFVVAGNNREQAEMDSRAVLAGIKHRLVLLQIAAEKLRDTEVLVPKPTRRVGMPGKAEYSVALRKVTEGELVKDSAGAAAAVFQLVMDTVLKMNAAVPERFLGEVKVGQKVQIQVEAYPGRVFEGTIARMSPAVDPANRTFQVEALVANPVRELRPGGFAEGEVLTRVDPEACTVPLESVVSFAGTTKVFVVRDGKARVVLVTPGVEGRGWVELLRPDLKEIARGTPVVTSGQSQLADGAPVTIRQPRATSGPTRAGAAEPRD